MIYDPILTDIITGPGLVSLPCFAVCKAPQFYSDTQSVESFHLNDRKKKKQVDDFLRTQLLNCRIVLSAGVHISAGLSFLKTIRIISGYIWLSGGEHVSEWVS